jgi:ectoine hydroxylase-related dioxygenase (phytanoyl-CoA dioxygenase family)
MIPTIDEAHRKAMETAGFTVFEDVFSRDEMADLASVLEAFERRMHEALVAQGGSSGISRAGEITFTDHIAEQDEAVRKFVTRPEFVELTTAFLGPDTDLYWNQTVFKHPEGEREFPWHQDDAYTPVTPAPYLTLWLAISDTTLENGCISVLPGSHLGGLRPHENSPIGLVGYSNQAPDQGVTVPISAGSIACFWSLTLHRSGPNRSKEIRKAYVIQYAPAGLRYAASGDLVPDLMPVARNGAPA